MTSFQNRCRENGGRGIVGGLVMGLVLLECLVVCFGILVPRSRTELPKQLGHDPDNPGWTYEAPIFNCTPLPLQPKATNINQLRHQDIKAFMSMGDSISAGFGLYSRRLYDPLDLVEYRGEVWHSGGNEYAYTAFNFFKHYNPNITGGSLGKSSPLDVIKWREHELAPLVPKIDQLNGAQSEARVEQLPQQVDYLTEQLQTTFNGTVDFYNDWKLLNIFIGANNLCFSCQPNATNTSAEFYGETLNAVIEKVYNQIPRVFINLMPIFNISQVYNVSYPDNYCRFLWNSVLKNECPCLQGEATPEDRQTIDIVAQGYNQQIYSIAEKWQAIQDPNFTVKVQPFLTDLRITNLRYLSNVDCFHPSYLADEVFTVGLWNSMQLPQDMKPHNASFPMGILCPNENTFLQ